MPESTGPHSSDSPIHIRSVPDDQVLRPKHKPGIKSCEDWPRSAPLPAFCRLSGLSGSIQRLGGSAFSAFKPLLARSHKTPSLPDAVESSQAAAAVSPSAGSGIRGSCSAHSSERVDTSGESAASLNPGLISPTNSLFQVAPRNLSAASLQCEPSGGSSTSIVGRSLSEDWLKTNARSRYQEKNRKAQARFRERRKTEAALKAERLAEFEIRRGHLTRERDDLAVKTETLEQCLIQQASSGAGNPCVPLYATQAPTGCGNDKAANSESQKSYPETWEQYTTWYQGLIQDLAPLLENAQRGESSATKRVEGLWREAVDVLRACMLRPDGYLRLRAQTEPSIQSTDTTSRYIRPDAALYASVMGGLHLTDEQIQHAGRLHNEFLDSMRAVLQQRQAFNAIIQASIPKNCEANGIVAQQHSKCLDVFPRLEATLEDERRINGRLTLGFFEHVVTPIQGAILCVGLWPFLPDNLAILTAITKPAPSASGASANTSILASQLPAAMDRTTLSV